MTSSARLIAQLALRTKIGPSDLLDAPVSVLQAMMEILTEQHAAQQQETTMANLRAALQRS